MARSVTILRGWPSWQELPASTVKGAAMPANVESMFSVRQQVWHDPDGKFTIDEYPGSWEAARKLSGLDWDPVTAPVYARTGNDPAEGVLLETFGPVGGNEPSYDQVEGWNLIKRSDTGAILSVRPESYTLIDNGEMGGIVEAVLAQENVKWETAGVLDGGKAVWCLAMLDEPIELKGDSSVTMPYLAITNRHDGTGACTLRATMVRIVCANTFRAAELEGDRTGATFSFVHRQNWRDRIEEARNAVTQSRDEVKAYTNLAEHLLGIKVTPKQRELFVTQFIPMPPDGLITDRVAANVEQARNAVRGILDGTTTDGVSYTAYGLVQAAGEYLDHVRTARTWETRLNRTLMHPEPLKRKALALVKEVVNA